MTFTSKLDQLEAIHGSLNYLDNVASYPLDQAETHGKVKGSDTDGAVLTAAPTNFSSTSFTFTAQNVGDFIRISSGANAGTFKITAFVDANNVTCASASFTNESSINFEVRQAQNAEDDYNYLRTRWKEFLGSAASDWFSELFYTDPTNTAVPKRFDVTNVKGHTLDAKEWADQKEAVAQAVSNGNTEITVADTTKYTTAVDHTGLPMADVGEQDETEYDATFVELVDQETGQTFTDKVQNMVFDAALVTGNLIDGSIDGTAITQVPFNTNNNTTLDDIATEIALNPNVSTAIRSGSDTIIITPVANHNLSLTGFTVTGGASQAGITSSTKGVVWGRMFKGTELTNFKVKFFTGTNNGTAVPYTWSPVDPASINTTYSEIVLLTNLPRTSFRKRFQVGIEENAETGRDIDNLQSFTGGVDGDSTPNWTNTAEFYALDGNPTDLQTAINDINDEIGDRQYTSNANIVISDGETITASLEKLASLVADQSVLKITEVISSTIPKETAHTLPSSKTYVLDAGGNGQNMDIILNMGWLTADKLTETVDYEETSTTQVTFHGNVNASAGRPAVLTYLIRKEI